MPKQRRLTAEGFESERCSIRSRGWNTPDSISLTLQRCVSKSPRPEMTKGRFRGPISRKRRACHRLCRTRLPREAVSQVPYGNSPYIRIFPPVKSNFPVLPVRSRRWRHETERTHDGLLDGLPNSHPRPSLRDARATRRMMRDHHPNGRRTCPTKSPITPATTRLMSVWKGRQRTVPTSTIPSPRLHQESPRSGLSA